ncbi:MAG TPA: hypothetical protein VMS78_04240 [Rhizomicrobium sp.]|nr:hypothetical protein [Rhizomicrobium sp.]
MSEDSDKKLFGAKPFWLAVVAFVVLIAIVGGYFALQRGGMASKVTSGNDTQSASAAPSPSGTCGTALARVRDYGVVPFNSELSGTEEGKKDTSGRVECAAASGDQTYSMLVNLSCDDLSDPKCLEIYRVTQGNGNALFQKRPYSF